MSDIAGTLAVATPCAKSQENWRELQGLIEQCRQTLAESRQDRVLGVV